MRGRESGHTILRLLTTVHKRLVQNGNSWEGSTKRHYLLGFENSDTAKFLDVPWTVLVILIIHSNLTSCYEWWVLNGCLWRSEMFSTQITYTKCYTYFRNSTVSYLYYIGSGRVAFETFKKLRCVGSVLKIFGFRRVGFGNRLSPVGSGSKFARSIGVHVRLYPSPPRLRMRTCGRFLRQNPTWRSLPVFQTLAMPWGHRVARYHSSRAFIKITSIKSLQNTISA